jgi:hypothetical protein
MDVVEILDINVCYENIVKIVESQNVDNLFEATEIYINQLRELEHGQLIEYFHLHIISSTSKATTTLIENQSLEFLDILLPHIEKDGVIPV